MTFYDKLLNFDKMKFKLNEKYIENTKNTNIGILYLNKDTICYLFDFFPICYSSQLKLLAYSNDDYKVYKKLLLINDDILIPRK